MLLDVPVQVCLLPKTSVADRTLERLLLVVDVPNVSLEVGGDAERTLAVLTLVRLLSGVCAQVTGQIGRAGEDLSAVSAAVLGFGVDAMVRKRWVQIGVGFEEGGQPRPGKRMVSRQETWHNAKRWEACWGGLQRESTGRTGPHG